MAFKVDVPVDKEGQGGGKESGKPKGDTVNEKAMQDLTKQIALGNIIASTLSSVTDGLSQLIAPLTRVLSALFVVIFLPLLPLLTKLIDGLSGFVFDVAEAGGGLKGLVEALKKNFDIGELAGLGAIIAGLVLLAFTTGLAGVAWPLLIAGALALWADDLGKILVDSIGSWWTIILTSVIGGIIIAMLAVTVAATAGWVIAIGAIVLGIFIAFWKPVSKVFMAFVEVVKSTFSIWDTVTAIFFGFTAAVFGMLVKQFIPRFWNAIKDLGKLILDAVINALKSLGSGFSTARSAVGNFVQNLNPFNDFIQRPGMAATSFSAQDTIIGVKDPKTLGGGGRIKIVINNPTFRSDDDIRKMVEMMSRKLQAKGNRRFSGR